MLMAFLPRASGEEAVIESNKSKPIYTQRGEQAGLLAMEPGSKGRQKTLRSVRKNVPSVWEDREKSDRKCWWFLCCGSDPLMFSLTVCNMVMPSSF